MELGSEKRGNNIKSAVQANFAAQLSFTCHIGWARFVTGDIHHFGLTAAPSQCLPNTDTHYGQHCQNIVLASFYILNLSEGLCQCKYFCLSVYTADTPIKTDTAVDVTQF